ncbi:MAG: FAD-dependent monooxygenase [Nitrospirae bacterium]|nr:FAD-dependent monooxygenase [Nitrospirota bacterium]
MRIGVIGPGMAGLTFAALIRRYGHEVELFERAADFSQTGYALGLWPMGSRVLNALGLRDRFEAVSQPSAGLGARQGNALLFARSHARFDPEKPGGTDLAAVRDGRAPRPCPL